MTGTVEQANKMLSNSNILDVMQQVDEMNKQAIAQKRILIGELIQNLLAHKSNAMETVKQEMEDYGEIE